MNRTVMFAAALASAMVPAAASAQGEGAYYTVVAQTQPAQARAVVRGTLFRCEGTTCTANQGNGRDAIMCELVAREFGTLAEFRANGTAFDAAALAKCNEKAK